MSKKKHAVDVENDQHKQTETEHCGSGRDSKSGNTMTDCD